MNPIDSSNSTMPAKQPPAVYGERLLPALAQLSRKEMVEVFGLSTYPTPF